MNFDDIKDQLLSLWNRILEKIQDTPFYTQMKDRFDTMSPRGQRMVVLSAVVAVFLVLAILPFSWFSDSSDQVTSFESRRGVIRELLKVSREASEVPDIKPPPPPEALKQQIADRVKEGNLIDEQIKSIDLVPLSSSLIPAEKSNGAIAVTLSKLNLRQLVMIGTRLSQISPAVKMTDLDINANREDSRYFDVVFRLTALAVPDLSTPPPPPEDAPTKKRPTKKSKPKRESEE